jgi:hypothetical protein
VRWVALWSQPLEWGIVRCASLIDTRLTPKFRLFPEKKLTREHWERNESLKIDSWGRSYKTFTVVINMVVLVTVSHLHPCVIFMGKAWSLPFEWCLVRGSTQVYSCLASNLRLRWKWLKHGINYRVIFISFTPSFCSRPVAARQVSRRLAYAGEGRGHESFRKSLVKNPKRAEQRKRPKISKLIGIASQQVLYSQHSIFFVTYNWAQTS